MSSEQNLGRQRFAELEILLYEKRITGLEEGLQQISDIGLRGALFGQVPQDFLKVAYAFRTYEQKYLRRLSRLSREYREHAYEPTDAAVAKVIEHVENAAQQSLFEQDYLPLQ